MDNPRIRYKYWYVFSVGTYADASLWPTWKHNKYQNDDDLPAWWLRIEFLKIRLEVFVEQIFDMDYWFNHG